MTDFETIPEKSMTWIENQAINNELEVEDICKKFLEIEKDLRETASLCKESEDPDAGFEDDEYYDIIESNVNSWIISIKGTPTTELEVFIIGKYAPQTLPNGSLKMDVIGWCVNPEVVGAEPEPVIITAWQEQVGKASNFRQFGCYSSKFSFDPENKKNGMYEISVTDATEYNEVEAFSWIGGADVDTDKKRYKVITSVYQDLITLDKINEPKSKSGLREGYNGKSFVDVTDFKRIKGQITRVGEDPQGEWYSFGIVDKTFKISGKNKDISIWANPQVASELGIGEGSTVEFFGTITWNKKNNIAQMAACTIIPKLLKSPTTAKNKIRAGGATADVESTPKKLNLNLGLEG